MLLRADGKAPDTIRRADGVSVDKIIRADGTEIYAGVNILASSTALASSVASFVYLDFATGFILRGIRRLTIRKSNGQIILSGTPTIAFTRFILTDADGTSITIGRGGGATVLPFANQLTNRERVVVGLVE